MTKINFTGSLEEIKKQVEQTVATYELLGNRSSVNFEQWFEAWETGFPSALENRALGNYQLTGDKIWRDDASKRPRWRRWFIENGVITGEYWRDRSIENRSIVLSGTSEQVIEHIIQIEYVGKSTEETPASFIGGGEVKRQGRPQLYVYFTEDESDVEPGYNPIRSEISMRLMDQTETSLTRADLNRYATKIQNVFGSQGGKIWKRGKDMASYTDWERGYQLQLLVRSKSDGEELIKNFLSIQDAPFAKKKYFYNENQDWLNAYPTNPGEEIILGKEIKKARKRPITQIRFESAWLSLGSVRRPIYLIDLSGRNTAFSDLTF
ncbi:hypothetical protein Q5692_35695 [Microcoleus sp. C2C3]|uniref:hypothetical protein n=1 Tax=unclassified Microcoleus TaxID=2642155 RepID=UPI002FD3A665